MQLEVRADGGAGPTPARPEPTATPRSALRTVAVPSEHGGWGLTAEPILLGLLIAPGPAGACLGIAALAAFLARTPLRFLLVDRRRGRHLERTALAARVFAVEAVVIVLAVVGAFSWAEAAFWWPAVVAAPLIGVELSYEARSRGRRLLPELLGAIGISSVVAMIVLADGAATATATAAWAVLGARVATAIPAVRAQIARLHGREVSTTGLLLGDLAAVGASAAAVALDRSMLGGALAIAVVIAVQRLTARSDTSAKVVGVRQMLLGFGVVAATAAGTHLS